MKVMKRRKYDITIKKHVILECAVIAICMKESIYLALSECGMADHAHITVQDIIVFSFFFCEY